MTDIQPNMHACIELMVLAAAFDMGTNEITGHQRDYILVITGSVTPFS